MRLRSLELENFRRYRRVAWEVPDGVTAILGANGAGKSTLLEALLFALHGASALRTPKELVRSEGAAPADPVRVAVELDWDGHAVRLVRELRGRSLAPQATLTVDGAVLVPPGAGSNEAATQEVQKRLGMDLDAFVSTLVARQGELARLAEAKPLERRQLLLRLVGVERLDAAIDRARERRRAAEAGLEATRRLARPVDPARRDALLVQVRRSEDQLAQAGDAVRSAQAALDAATLALQAAQEASTARRDAQDRLDRLRREAELAAQAARQAEAALAQAQVAQAQAVALQAPPLQEIRAALATAHRSAEAQRSRALALRHASELEAQVKRLRLLAGKPPLPEPPALPDVEGAQKARRDAAAALAVLAARRREHEAHLDQVRRLGPASACPTCRRALGGHLEELLAGETEGLRRLAGEEQAAQRAAREAEANWLLLGQKAEAARREQLAAAREAALRQQSADELVRAEAALAAAQAALPAEAPPGPDPVALERSLREAEAVHEQRIRLLAAAEGLPRLQRELADRQAGWLVVQASHAAAQADPRLAQPDPLPAAQAAWQRTQAAERHAAAALAQAHQDAASLQAAAAALAEQERQERLRQEEEARLEADVRAWAALAGRSGDGLLDRFRDHLASRIGPALAAEASRLLARFTGGRYTELLLDEEYRVFVSDGGVPYTLDRFSGGEQDLAHLALRLAASRLAAERSGLDLRLLALDEVFGSLDRGRRDLVVAALQELGGLYSQVLVVSHLDGLREALGQAVEVVDEGGEATILIQNG